MKNRKKLFFLISLIGILLLLFFSETIQPKIIQNITQISRKNLEEKISIQGKIEKINHGSGRISLFLEDSDLEIIIFTNNLDLQKQLKKEQEIIVKGRVDFYKNKLQIIADKISIIN